MKKLLAGIIVVVLIIGMFSFGIQKEQERTNSSSTGKEIVKIGVTLPLTGPLAEPGQVSRNAINMKIDSLSKNNSKYEYKVFFEDDAWDKKRELMNAQKFINVNKVDVIISFAAGAGFAISELAKQNNVIHFDFTWGDEIVENSDYSFNYFTQPCDMSKKLVKKIADLGHKKISLIAFNHVGANYSVQCFTDEVNKYPDLEILDVEKVSGTSNNMAILVKKMSEKNSDVYLAEIHGDILEMWGKELKLQNIKTQIAATTTFAFCQNLGLFNGAIMVENAQPSDNYFKEYKETYGENPEIVGASFFYYDIIDLLSKVYEKYDKKPTTEQIKNDLLSIKGYVGEAGPISVDKDGRFTSKPSSKMIVNGKIEILKEDE